jgi:membrane protease YdiL (CAAX protease family)
VAFVARLPISFALGWIFLRRGSLWAPIGMHAVFNGLQVLAAAALGEAILGGWAG